MHEDRITEFYKKIGLYNEDLFNQIKENTTLIDGALPNASYFYGVFLVKDGFRVLLPKIKSELDELIWIHEYAHIISHHYSFTDDEFFPNLLESYYTNMYIEDKEKIIEKTEKEISESTDEEHTLAKKMKLLNIK